MREKHDGLLRLVARIGLERAAERFDVTEKTVKGWLKLGLPTKRRREVTGAVRRSDNAARAAKIGRIYKERGWTKLRNFDEVDREIGTEAGHTRRRWRERKEWWDEHRPDERLPTHVSLIRTHDGPLLDNGKRLGQVLYVNGDRVMWRAYTVDGRLFWTLANNLEGYDTDEDFVQRYDTLPGHEVRIFF